MAVEIEAKMKVPDHAGVRARLAAVGGQRIGSFAERNTFYDTDGGTLEAADRGLRIRHSRDRDDGTVVCTMTHKGARQHGPLKSREETELTVDGDAAGMLECLGFQRVMSFEKRRESWALGDCKVELDEVPHLGTYVEVEGPTEAAVLHVRQQLGLAELPMIKTGYIALLVEHLKARGETVGDVTFESAVDQAGA